MSRGESISDTARVLSKYVDLIIVECFDHQMMIDLAKNSSVPVINGLTDQSHPCQVMADLLTIEEKKELYKIKIFYGLVMVIMFPGVG